MAIPGWIIFSFLKIHEIDMILINQYSTALMQAYIKGQGRNETLKIWIFCDYELWHTLYDSSSDTNELF